MNASQRRILRRATAKAMGLIEGTAIINSKGTAATLVRVSPTGGRNVKVKRKSDSRMVLWPLTSLATAHASHQ